MMILCFINFFKKIPIHYWASHLLSAPSVILILKKYSLFFIMFVYFRLGSEFKKVKNFESCGLKHVESCNKRVAKKGKR